MKPDVPDVFSWILDEYNSHGKPTYQDEINLRGDAGLITVAGRSVFDSQNQSSIPDSPAVIPLQLPLRVSSINWLSILDVSKPSNLR